jgi:hypothetical protein
MLMEDAMPRTDKLMECTKPVVLARYLDDTSSLYILVAALLATLFLTTVWCLTAAAL